MLPVEVLQLDGVESQANSAEGGDEGGGIVAHDVAMMKWSPRIPTLPEALQEMVGYKGDPPPLDEAVLVDCKGCGQRISASTLAQVTGVQDRTYQCPNDGTVLIVITQTEQGVGFGTPNGGVQVLAGLG